MILCRSLWSTYVDMCMYHSDEHNQAKGMYLTLELSAMQ